MTTLFKLISTNEHIFENFRNEEMEEIIENYKQEFEKIKNSLSSDDACKIQTLLMSYKDYLEMVELEKQEKYAILAVKIGIELGKYFKLLEDF